MTNPEKILDYDKLVETYSANLDVTLRGFRPADEMLDTWVPDEDHVRSICSLVEAAQLGGANSVTLRVLKSTLGGLWSGSLPGKLASFGLVTFIEEAEALVITVAQLQETASFRSVRPIYQQKLRARFANLGFKRTLKVEGTQIPLRATDGPFALSWAVQTDQHIIRDAVFEGSANGPMLATLDCLCEILTGLPVQEARDHSVIRTEFSLRDPRQVHPVAGIVLPKNADPIFRVPSILVNRLFADYITSTGYRPVMNFFDPGPKAAWKALSPEEREKQLSEAIAANAAGAGLHNGEVQVVECKFPYAVTIRFNDELTIPEKRKIALKLERLVREKCDPRLEVFCEEKKDLSKLRRLIEKANV